jgi:hypothetical protein
MDLGGEGYTPFERELLFRVLDAQTRAADVLKQQIAQSRVIDRSFTGHGSFTEIEVSPNAPSAHGICSTPGEQCYVGIWRPGFEAPAGCVVFISAEGYVDLLEVYTHGDHWPDDPAVWKIVAGDLEKNPLDRPRNS